MISRLGVSEYNRDQWITFRAIADACRKLTPSEIAGLRDSLASYLHFREAVDRYQARYFHETCRGECFETGTSACCGFESIITFFADHAISYLLSDSREMSSLFEALEKPNTTSHCVYLGEHGCLWKVRPITCAMFFCSPGKKSVFPKQPEAESILSELKEREKEFTWPTKPVLFDDLEAYFIRLGLESPHLHFHRSPGLLRLKTSRMSGGQKL